MEKKYQIFVSSTYDDLKEQRDAVTKAILEIGHIPVGMEMFSAADEAQWEIIKSHIDDADYYVVIVAHRYGSEVDGISFTEKEYDYASEKGVPILGFIISDDAPWPANRVQADKSDAIARFKAKVRQKPVDTWADANQLHAQIAIALPKQFRRKPRPGWVRSNLAASPEAIEQIGRLSRENAELREAAEKASSKVSLVLSDAHCYIATDGHIVVDLDLLLCASGSVSISVPIRQIKVSACEDLDDTTLATSRDVRAHPSRPPSPHVAISPTALTATGPGEFMVRAYFPSSSHAFIGCTKVSVRCPLHGSHTTFLEVDSWFERDGDHWHSCSC